MNKPETSVVAVALFLAIATFIVYSQVLSHGFINYDDPVYVTQNPHISTGLSSENIRWAFTAIVLGNWQPLTLLSHMSDAQLYGLNAWGHHLTNVLLHIANAVLLFIVLKKMTGALWRSAFVAALFALHPLRVESVAWISERKDVLSTFFFIGTLYAYAFYAERPGVARYLPVVFLFGLGLMAKPMVVTLPFVLLLLDYWPLHRLSVDQPLSSEHVTGRQKGFTIAPSRLFQLTVEKIPLFLLSAIASALAVYAQKADKALMSGTEYSLAERVSNALVAYVGYVRKTFWPTDLAVLYPLQSHVSVWHASLAFVLLAGVSASFLRVSRRHPALLTGWLWFLGTLVPVIGLVQVGLQEMADRYTYIPSIGLYVSVTWGAAALTKDWRHRSVTVATLSAIVFICLTAATWNQIGYWKSSASLFAHTVKVTENNYIAYANLGDALEKEGRYREAAYSYQEALRIKPINAFVHYKLATVLDMMGRLDEAVSHYRRSLDIDPSNARAHSNFGIALIRLGKTAEAKDQFEQAIRLDPRLGFAHYNLGLALASEGRLKEAVSHYYEALRIDPSDAEIRMSLESALAQLQRGQGLEGAGRSLR